MEKDNNEKSFEELLKKEFKRADENTQRVVDKSGVEGISDLQKETIHANLRQQIQAYENEKIYAQLSDEDREALELGKKIMNEKNNVAEKRVSKKMSRHGYLVLAAVLILAMAFGMTSVGGPKKILQMVTSSVGERKVEKSSSSEDFLTLSQEKEEEAYQQLKDIFGTEPVKIIQRPDGMTYESLVVDEELQTAEMYYKYNGENVIYCINAGYADAAWGVDVEDQVVDEYEVDVNGESRTIKEHRIDDGEKERYSIKFADRGLEYFLIGTMEKEEFEKMVSFLHFP